MTIRMAELILSKIRPVRSVQSVPLDTTLQNHPRRILSPFAQVPIQPLQEPLKLIAASEPALNLLLTGEPEIPERIDLSERHPLVSVFAGNTIVHADIPPVAHRYWGTQFGNYADQLGDGAAMLIGEAGGYEINLKGSGITPFSRGFDGRKVVRSSIREFLCSEAMAGLGIPTTRAGTVILSENSKVMRDVNYSGQPIWENCAVVARIAKTFIRFGSFESRDPADSQHIQQLLKFTWERLLKPLRETESDSFMDVVIDRTARTVALWSSVGFVHGVMNTDNMSIIGDTIDYGPFGFIESFDPHFVPNTSDKYGRYAFSEQPRVAEWNLKRLNETLVLHGNTSFCAADAEYITSRFRLAYERMYYSRMRAKLGLSDSTDVDTEFEELLKDFWKAMDVSAVDFTYTFRCLCDLTPRNVPEIRERIMTTFPSPESQVRLSSVGLRVSRVDLPEIEEFARTRLAELERFGIDLNTICRWKHKLERIERLTRNEPDVRASAEASWDAVLTRLAGRISDRSRSVMLSVNPAYVPRLSLMQEAIKLVERDRDMSEVEKLLRLFQSPFIRDGTLTHPELYEKPNLADYDAVLSCSS